MRISAAAFLALVAFAPLASLPAFAQAPQTGVSDADRAAARDLYFQGAQLQQQGKFDQALDKFQRAQSVLSAPTHLLHIAECQAALGRLVEAAETYRTLQRTNLGPTPPAAFSAAQTQGNAELQQVEPRIPSLKIDVQPAGIQGLQVAVDDQPMNTALVGVARPTNPGTHKVTASAPGYGKVEQSVTLKERETKGIALALQATPGVVFVPTPGTEPATTPPPAASSSAAPPPPAPYEHGQDWKEAPKGSSKGWLLGLHAGAMIPTGTLSGTVDLADAAGPGAALGLEGGFRFAKNFLIGGALQGAVLKGNTGTLRSVDDLTAQARTGSAGLHLAWITNPQGFGFWGDLGVAYRFFSYELKQEIRGSSTNYVDTTRNFGGADLTLGAGVTFRAGDHLMFVPKASVAFGTFSTTNRSCDSGGTGVCTPSISTETITDPKGHTFVFLGLTGFYVIDNGP